MKLKLYDVLKNINRSLITDLCPQHPCTVFVYLEQNSETQNTGSSSEPSKDDHAAQGDFKPHQHATSAPASAHASAANLESIRAHESPKKGSGDGGPGGHLGDGGPGANNMGKRTGSTSSTGSGMLFSLNPRSV
jgi:hypothetical protein